jgi:hydrogenase/urease accessory protein HupE
VSPAAHETSTTRYCSAAWVAVALCALPGPARAHLAQTGLGPFYDGIAHLFVSPEQLSSLLALALLAGLGGPAHGRAALAALLVAWPVGGVLGMQPGVGLAPGTGASERLAAAVLLLSGGLAAWDLELPVRRLALLVAVLGLVCGAVGGLDIVGAGMGWSGLAGTIVAVWVAATLAIALATAAASRPLGRRIVRVAGSWLAASGLLWLGWLMR